MNSLPVSAIVPTRLRAAVLGRTLDSLLTQSHLPAELIVVDASPDEVTRQAVENFARRAAGTVVVRCLHADVAGAASQRNQGVAAATQPVIWFLDDDILFEPDCVARLWSALHSAPDIGGVNAMIINQRYLTPGWVSGFMFRLVAGEACDTYAGRVLGPAVNLLPEDREDLPEVVPVEWLNTTCTMYRREVLPQPPFPDHFTGYSLMEDVTLSLTVGRSWRLVNARTARIFHDSQPGSHKQSIAGLGRMQLINRYYVMTRVLGRDGFCNHAKLLLWELFGLVSSVTSLRGMLCLPQSLAGRCAAVPEIVRMRCFSS